MRGDVALGGNFGFELDPDRLTEEELSEIKKMIARVKAVRHLTREGTFWRLLSPYGGSSAAWSFVSEDRKDVLLCVYMILSVPNTPPLRVRLHGLLPDSWYETEDGRRFSGAALMYQGITVFLQGDFSSEVIHLKSL